MKRVEVLLGLCLLSVLIAAPAWTDTVGSESAREPSATPDYADRRYDTGEFDAGRWAGGGGLGFIGSTPDGTAFGMNGSVDYFLNEHVSVGPLLQLGFTNDMTLVGLSGQGKYWFPLPGTGGRGKIALQSGLGFAHADFRANDTSWLIPLGIGYEYTLPSGTTLNATSMVNFTNLHTGGGSGADVMPGLMFGVRF